VCVATSRHNMSLAGQMSVGGVGGLCDMIHRIFSGDEPTRNGGLVGGGERTGVQLGCMYGVLAKDIFSRVSDQPW
jgi:hypothetical protein